MAYETDAEWRLREQEARWQRRWDERERAWERERNHLEWMADWHRRQVDSTEEWAHMVLAMFLLAILGLTVLVVHFAMRAG